MTAPYPRGSGLCETTATVVCDGTWVGPFTVLVAAGGARKESGMARDPGGPVATVAGEAPAMARSRRPPVAAQGAMANAPATGRAGSQSCCPGDRNRRRGCRKATHGTRAGSQGARRGSQGGATGASRAGWYRPQGCRRGTRVPVAPSGSLRGRTARGVANDKWGTRPELVEGRPRTPSVSTGLTTELGKKARAFFRSGVAEPYSAGVGLRALSDCRAKPRTTQHATEETL